MSVGGMFVETEAPLLFDETISLKFALPDLKEPIEVEAQVRWVERRAWERNGAGLQFVGLRAKYMWALNKFLAGKEPAE
jgi:Tfp pilus assembly protein PilZ